jgi:hypothetical protein
VSTGEVAQLLLMGVVVPLWIAAGLADWACHRRTRIERTSGLRENMFHWILLAEGGVALLAAALLQPDAGVLLIVFAAFLAHELTTYIELRYTALRRPILPFEQMVHSYMELLPLILLVLLAMSNWGQVLALFDQATPDLGVRPKEPPWPPAYLLGAGLAALLLNVLPLAEETWRCARERRAYA